MNDIIQAVAALSRGQLVAFPTETVYGLGADANNPNAVQKIFKLKGRPRHHPLIVHIADVCQLHEWAVDIPDATYSLAKTFWPGPLTLILKKASHVSDWVTGGQETIGLRIPQHPIARTLLEKFGTGIAAPSANRFGHISATTADAVLEEFGKAVNFILDGGQCSVGIESTIVDMTAAMPGILRLGAISKHEIASHLSSGVTGWQINSPRVSGSLASHYAPDTLTKMISSVTDFLNNLKEDDFPCALLIRKKPNVILPNKTIDFVIMPDDPQQYAHDLYHTLRMLDKKQYRQLVIEALPDTSMWDTVRDRLTRATALRDVMQVKSLLA